MIRGGFWRTFTVLLHSTLYSTQQAARYIHLHMSLQLYVSHETPQRQNDADGCLCTAVEPLACSNMLDGPTVGYTPAVLSLPDA